MSTPTIVASTNAPHYTDLGLALARELMPLVARFQSKTGMMPGPGAEGFLTELLEYLAGRPDALDAYRAARARDTTEHAVTIERPPATWLETNEALTRLATTSVSELVGELALVPSDSREAVLAPIVEYAEATGSVDFDKLDAIKSAIAESRPAVEVEMTLAAGAKAGDEIDWHEAQPESLVGRRVRVIGFGREPGTLRVVDVGPWESDPNERESIGGEGPTNTFMAGSQAPPDTGTEF